MTMFACQNHPLSAMLHCQFVYCTISPQHIHMRHKVRLVLNVTQALAYHFIPSHVFNLLLAANHMTVHTHGLKDKAYGSSKVEAVS